MFTTSYICERCLLRSLRVARAPPWTSTCRFQSTSATTANIASLKLLSKARSIAEEHKKLSAQLNEGFNTNTARRIGEISSIATAFQEWEHANNSLSELQALIQDKSTDDELRSIATSEMAETQDSLASATTSLTKSLIPKHPFAHLPCLIEIRPGVGGSEAGLFASDLIRMYQSYCSRHGLRAIYLKYEDAAGTSDPSTSDAPVTEAILEIENAGAYGKLRCEAGVHRVQRVPATESKGRTHTSAASVLVLPSFPKVAAEGLGQLNLDDPTSDYYVDVKDVRIDIMKARGAGGQHVNTTSSAVRLTHAPSGVVVSMQDSRSQHKNKEKAWQLLRARLAQQRREAREEEMLRMRRSVVGVAKIGRGDKIRTYNWGQQRVTDHRSGLSVHNLDDVMEGGDCLEKVMDSVRKWHSDQEMEQMVAEDIDGK